MDTARMLRKVVDLVMYLVTAVLGLRFIFRLVGANADNGFVNWIYDTSGEMVSPFRNIFVNPSVDGAGVVDFTALIALVVYGLLALLVVHLIGLWSPKK